MDRRYGKLELDWGVFAETFFDVISVVNLNFELTSPECAAAGGTDVWVLKWVLTMMLPVFAGGAVAFVAGVVFVPLIVAGIGPFADKNMAVLFGGARRVWYQLVVMLYLPLTAGAFSVFGCRKEESGEWVMDAAPSRRCYTSSWWGLFTPALIACAVYGAGLPLGVVLFLRSRVQTMDRVEFVLKYGFLVGRFRDDAWWYEAAIMGRKMGVVLCVTAFSADQSKAAAIFLALVVSLVQVGMTRPYGRMFHNWLAVFVLSGTCLTLAGALFTDANARHTFAAGGIVLTVIGIVVGNGVDLWIIQRAEAEVEKDEFYSDGVFANARDDSFGGEASLGSSAMQVSTLPSGSGDAHAVPAPLSSVTLTSINTPAGSSGGMETASFTELDSGPITLSSFQMTSPIGEVGSDPFSQP